MDQNTLPIIEVPLAFCHRHWHQGEQQGKAMAVACLKMFEKLLEDEKVQQRAGYPDWVPAVVNDAMRWPEFVPWCCYLGDTVVEAAFAETPWRNVGQ